MRSLCPAHFYLLLLLICSACASKKETVVESTKCDVQSFSLEELNRFSAEQENLWYKIKGDAEVNFKEEHYKMDVQVRMKLNELMWISVSKGGFPIAKFLFRSDSVFFVDLFNRQYLRSNYDAMEEKAGMSLSFETVQRIFLGQSLNFEDSIYQWVSDGQIVMSDEQKEGTGTTDIKTSSAKAVRAQWVNCQTKEIEKQLYRLPSKQDELWLRYSGYKEEGLINYPRLISIRAMRAQAQRILCNFELNSFKSSDSLNIPFEIPADYEELQ